MSLHRAYIILATGLLKALKPANLRNHLRAILDLPLGPTKARGYTGMVNFIGDLPSSESVLKIPNAHLHLYDKAARKGRKVGHAAVRSGKR